MGYDAGSSGAFFKEAYLNRCAKQILHSSQGYLEYSINTQCVYTNSVP